MNRNQSILFAFLAVSLSFFAATADKEKNVLIIGDSISIGYTPYVTTALAPDILVTHNPGNGGSTRRGVDSMEVWLNHKKWDLITFNFGLHDMIYKDDQNKNDVANGKVAVPLDEYRKNLESIVARLKKSTKVLLFVNTTVVPENSSGRKVEDPARYNEVAMEVMKNNHIPVIDLYTASLVIHPKTSKPGNVHYSPEGYELLAAELIKSIKEALK
ncbi:MAG TPA: SGNH/GDSL hydrolase family protein [Prolixibacteraceae bacterium]|nr:SGNH/GDSL hydrolase family protein [Prolixibacteraceae bacterium]